MELDTDDDLPTLARWTADPVVMRHTGRGPMTLAESEAALHLHERVPFEELGITLWVHALGAK